MDVNIRILVVDDEPDIRQLLRILLENRGYQMCIRDRFWVLNLMNNHLKK